MYCLSNDITNRSNACAYDTTITLEDISSFIRLL